jgi:PKD repeat protein
MSRRLQILAVVTMLCALWLPTAASAQAPPGASSLLVKLVDGLSPAQQADVIARNGGVEVSAIPALRLHVVEVATADLAAVLASYQADPQVAHVEENKVRRAEAWPSDPLYQNQWALPRIGWDLVFGNLVPSGAAKVAVLDTGIDALHPDLAGKVLPGTSILDGSDGRTDPSGHGTWLAGIIAAQTDTVPVEGIAGVAYAGVQVMPVTVLNASGDGQDSDVIAGVIWAADHGADVILMAFSNPGFSPNLQDAIDYAWSRGVVLVAAVGNDGAGTATFPAGDRGVIGVSGTDTADSLLTFSNYGQAAFLGAPGVDIAATDLGNAYSLISGTSTSAAIVAGVAAFMKAVDPTLTNGVIAFRMASTADPAGTQEQTGNGRVNMARALASTDMQSIQPAGAAPIGAGGPFVGPYRAAAANAISPTSGPIAGGTSVTITGNNNFASGGAPYTVVFDTTSVAAVRVDNDHLTAVTPAHAAGLVTVTPRDKNNNNAGTPTSFTYFGPAAKLAFTTQPGSGSAGSPLTSQPVVTVQDAAGTTVTTGTNSITLAIGTNPGGGTLSVATNPLAATNGTAAFSGVSIDAGGSGYTLTASSPGLAGATSNAFDVAQDRFTAVITPTTTSQGASTAYTLTVTNTTVGGNTMMGCVTVAVPSSFGTPTLLTVTATDNNGSARTWNAPTFGSGVITTSATSNGQRVAPTAGKVVISFTATSTGNGSATWTTSAFSNTGCSGAFAISGTQPSVTVNNVAPIVTAPANQTANEGAVISFSLGSFTDPGADSPWAVDVNWGDGSAHTTFNAASIGSLGTQSHTYGGNGTFTVTVTVTDKNGGSGSASFSVTVANVAPTVTAAANQTANEGANTSFSLGSFTDPGADSPWSVSVNWGDGGTTNFTTSATGSLGTRSHTYADNGSYTVTVTVTDKDGASDSKSFLVAVANLPPVVTPQANQTVNEAISTAYALGSFTDPGVNDNPWTLTVDWGDGSSETFTLSAQGALGPHSHTYANNGSYTVTLSLTDKDGGSDTKTFTITVLNVPPVVTPPLDQTTDEGTSTSFALGSFTDGGPDSPWSVDVDWGDGSSHTAFTRPVAGSLGSQSHTYPDNGTYLVIVTVTDKDGGQGSATFQVTVNNVAPTATFNAPGSVDEGSDIGLSLTSPFDPSSVDTAAGFEYAFDCGSGYGAFGAGNTATCLTTDNGSRTVKGKIRDKDGGETEYSASVLIANVPPSAIMVHLVASTIDENGSVTVNGSFTDPGSADSHTVVITWGDGSPDTFVSLLAGVLTFGPLYHTYLDNAGSPFTITATVTDDDTGSGVGSASVTVSNVAPNNVLIVVDPATIDENGSVTLQGSFLDPGTLDSHTVLINWGDGSPLTSLPLPVGETTFSGVTHQYLDNGAFTVAVAVTDKDLATSAAAETPVTVNNVAPSVTAGDDTELDEGQTLTRSGSFTDPGTLDTWTATVDYGDGSGVHALPLSGMTFTLSHLYSTVGLWTVTVTVTDDDAGVGAATFKVNVLNVPPTVAADNASVTVDESQTALNTGTYSDPGSNENVTFTASVGSITKTGTNSGTWSWSFGTTDGPAQSQTITITANDGKGGVSTTTFSLVVNNVPPTVVPAANQTAFEGTAQGFALGSFTDPGADSPWSVSVNWGDGGSTTFTTSAAGSLGTQSHTYADNGYYTVTVTVTDKDGTSDSETFKINVANVPPTVSAGGNATINEGSTFTRNGSFTDPGADTWTATVDYGDGSGVQPLTLTGKTFYLSHLYADNGLYTVTVTVTDDDGELGSASFQVNVANVPPTATLANGGPVNEASPVTISFSYQLDPSSTDTAAGFHYAYACDGSSLAGATYQNTVGNTASTTCTFDDGPSTPIVRARIIDKDGGFTEYTTTVSVLNKAPTAAFNAPPSVPEGTAISLSLTGAADVSAADFAAGFTYAFDCGFGYGSFGLSTTATCPTTDNGSRTVQGKIRDKDGGVSEYTATVAVTNVTPTLASLSGPAGPLALGSLATLTANFTDVGSADTHTCTFLWDDGTQSTIPAAGTGNGSCVATHTYTAAGVYSVIVTVSDDDSAVSISSTFQYVVIYDANAGFVTGGGWINSPSGAYVANPALTGKANFGFVSKYLKGATVPTGETEFQFQVGNFNFHSTAYEWLVISGYKAQYRGSGTVNGSGNYGFLLTAYDGQVGGGGGTDKFRIKIWDKNNGNGVVYDNKMNGSDDIDTADPQSIGGGSIIIHK